MFSDESRFCLQQLDRKVKVWRRPGERYADCCTDKVRAFGGGSVMVRDGISLTGKTRLVIIGGHLNAERYQDEILQPVAIPYLYCLGLNSILQDDNARPHTVGFIRDYLKNLGVERMECLLSSTSCAAILTVQNDL
uniref:Tc1-like transposase DDE domain-containing protein n=1 Tax=Mola mola TaxID=94237 RepID=A0A3Q4ALE6_MOLML